MESKEPLTLNSPSGCRLRLGLIFSLKCLFFALYLCLFAWVRACPLRHRIQPSSLLEAFVAFVLLLFCSGYLDSQSSKPFPSNPCSRSDIIKIPHFQAPPWWHVTALSRAGIAVQSYILYFAIISYRVISTSCILTPHTETVGDRVCAVLFVSSRCNALGGDLRKLVTFVHEHIQALAFLILRIEIFQTERSEVAYVLRHPITVGSGAPLKMLWQHRLQLQSFVSGSSRLRRKKVYEAKSLLILWASCFYCCKEPTPARLPA